MNKPFIKYIFIFFTVAFVQLNVLAQTPMFQSSISAGLSSPVKMAIDNSDNIYVTDGYQKCIIKYDTNGNLIEKIFVGNNPTSIAINQNNEIFIGDQSNGNILKVNQNGSQSIFYTGLSFPTSMTFSPEGLLYVADGNLHTVYVFDVSANVVQTFGTASLIFPTSIVYDNANSRILVSEHGGVGSQYTPVCKIWVFGLNGNLISSFASNGNGSGKFYRIQGMTIGKCGNLYVCDPFQGSISVFNENNVYLTKFGQFGNNSNELNVPLDVKFDSQQRIIVASMNNGNLEIYSINDTLPTSNISNSDATICLGQTANITVGFTGTSPFTFSYTINGLNPTTITTSDNPYFLSASQAGVYEITSVSDLYNVGNCFSGSAKITVNNSLPSATISTGNASICEGSALTIPINFTGNSPWTFTFTKDGINPTTITTANNPYLLSANIPGLYEVTSVSGGGCSSNNISGFANVHQNLLPTIIFTTSNVTICEGETANLPLEFTGTAPWSYTYTINNQNAITNLTNNNTSISTTEPGTYNIISVSDANCLNNNLQASSEAISEVVVKPLPTSTIANANYNFCEGTFGEIPIQFTGNAPYTFTYSINDSAFNTISTNNQNYSLSVVNSGTYNIITTIGDGCEGTENYGSANVNVYPKPALSLGPDLIVCENQTVILDPGVFNSYIWNDLSTNQTLNVNLSGTYNVHVLDVNGCSNSDEIVVTINNHPISNFSYTESGLEISFTNNSTNSIGYIWDFGDGTTSTETNPIHTYSTPGTYIISLTASNGVCIDSQNSTTLILIGTNILTNENSEIQIFPNPTSGLVYLKSNGIKGEFMVEVSNSIGQVLIKKKFANLNNMESINLSEFSSGIYNVVINSNEGIKSLKLILK